MQRIGGTLPANDVAEAPEMANGTDRCFRPPDGRCRRGRFDAHDDKIVNISTGAIAQLGERIVRNDEVVGSIPTSSTMFLPSFQSITKVVQTAEKRVCPIVVPIRFAGRVASTVFRLSDRCTHRVHWSD